MYLYFSNTRKLQTMIAHGSPVRQGDSFGLNVCFDLDFFKSDGNSQYLTNQSIPEYLYCYYKLPTSDSFEALPLSLKSKNVVKFRKNSNDEVTFKLIDDKKYFMYYAPINANQLTGNCGDLELVFSFYQLEENEINASNFSAKLYVEPTFGKNQPEPDSSVTLTDYQFLLGEITRKTQEKNIALEKIEDIEYTLNASVEEKLLTRANYIYETMAETKMGWVIIGATYKTVQQEVNGTEQDVEVIDVSDMYVLFSEDNMFVISSETGIIYKYTKYDDQYVLIPQMYSVNVFGDTLDSFIESLGKANLTELLQSFLSRISDLEVTTLQDIVYSGGKIKYKQNNSYHDLVTNAQLKEDLGINTIEGQGTFGVEYTNNELKAKNGLNSQKTTLFTAGSLKQDMNLDLVPNKAASGVIQNSENYFATVKAVFDTLENSAIGNENQNTNTTNFNEAMRRLRYMYQYFSEGTEDLDNKINKLEEIVQVLDNLPESADIYATINNIFNKIGEGEADSYFYNNDPNLTEQQRQSRTIKGRIEYLYQNADKNIIVFIRYSEPGNQELLTIPVANWVALNQPNENYPDAEYYAIINPRTVENPNNLAFDNVVDMEVIFDKESEKEYIVGAEFDTEQRALNIYANSLPDGAITIDTIKLISNIHHTMSLNVAESNLLANHTSRLNGHDNDISNLTRDKQEKSNLVTSFSAETSDTKYPSEKLVKDTLDNMFSKDFNDFHTRITNDLGWIDPNDHSQGFNNNVSLQSNKIVGGDATTAENMVFSSISVTDGIISANFIGKTNGTPFVNTLTFDYEGVLKLNGVDYSNPFVKKHFEGIYNSSLPSCIDIIEDNYGNDFKIVNKINSSGYNFGSMIATTPEDIEIFVTSDIRDVTTGNVVSTDITIEKDAFQVNSSGTLKFYGTSFKYNNNDIFTKDLIAATFTDNVADDTKVPSAKLVKDSLDNQIHYRELMEQRPIDTSETSLDVVIGELSNTNDYIEVLGYIYKTNSAGKEDRYRFNCLLKQPPLPGGGHIYYEEKQQLLRYSADSQSVILTVKCMYSVLDTSFKVNISVNSSGYNLMLESIRELINY